jgi:hypothetical protein
MLSTANLDMHAAVALFLFSNSAFSPHGPSFRPWSRASPASLSLEMLRSLLHFLFKDCLYHHQTWSIYST